MSKIQPRPEPAILTVTLLMLFYSQNSWVMIRSKTNNTSYWVTYQRKIICCDYW